MGPGGPGRGPRETTSPSSWQRRSFSTPPLTFRQLSGVKLRLEKGGGGSWARGEGPGEGPRRFGPRQLGPKAERNFLLEGKLQKGWLLAQGKPSQEKKH